LQRTMRMDNLGRWNTIGDRSWHRVAYVVVAEDGEGVYVPNLRVGRVVISSLVAVAAIGVVEPTATAASHFRSGLVGRPSPEPSPLARSTRYPFAGYITAPTTITSAAATIVVPNYTCPKKVAAIAAAAIVYDSTGAQFSSAEVYLGCSRKTIVLTVLTDVNNTYGVQSITIHMGDVVQLSATCGPSGIDVSIDDMTTSSTGSASSSASETCTQAEIGDDGVANQRGTSVVSLPSFGSITYTSATVDGASLGSFNPTAANYFEGKKNVITTGSLTDGGLVFSTTQG
jgi:hypothetical protein